MKACREGFPVTIIKKIANGIAQTKFASEVINERADLSAFKQKPTAKNFLGIFLMCCSSIIGWPAVGLIGALSIYWREPLLIIIGAPLCLITAHLVFLLGMYLAGGRYVMIFFRWATRVTLEKLMWKREPLLPFSFRKTNNWLTTALRAKAKSLRASYLAFRFG